MAGLCPHCGMESDRDNVCTWCNKSLVAGETREAAKPAAPPAAGGKTAVTPTVAPARPVAEPSTRQPEPLKPSIPIWACVVAAVVVAIIAGIGANALRAMAAAGPPPKPGQWKTLSSATKLLSLEAPDNWKFVTSGSGASYERVDVCATRFCTVRVSGSGTKGSMGDIMGASSNLSQSTDLQRRPEGKLHALLGGIAKKEDPNYEESGSMAPATFAGMNAAYSEYTTTRPVGLFAVKLKGWRMSCSGGDLGYDIRAEAPEKQWDAFEPSAKRILASFKLGPAH